MPRDTCQRFPYDSILPKNSDIIEIVSEKKKRIPKYPKFQSETEFFLNIGIPKNNGANVILLAHNIIIIS